MTSPHVHATQASIWISVARRRLAAVRTTGPGGPADEALRVAEAAQSLQALHIAIQHMDRAVRGPVKGLEWPSEVAWDRVRDFVKRFRDAVDHGPERLDNPGLGYNVRIEEGNPVVFGKARGDKAWREDRMSISELEDALRVLGDWAAAEESIR